MAYDYFYGGDCTDYENSAAYRASGDCETLIDDDSPARSATISVTSSGLVWTRNMGPTATSLGCPGEGAPGYYEFDVPSSDINTGACKNFKDIGGGFSFYDTSNATTPTETPAPKPVSTAPASTPSSASSSTTPSTNSATASSTSSGTVTSGNQGNSSSTTGSTLSPTTDLSGSSSSSPSPTPTSSTSTGRGLSVGAVSGISSGAAVLVVVIIVLAWCIVKRNKKTRTSIHDHCESRSWEEVALGQVLPPMVRICRHLVRGSGTMTQLSPLAFLVIKW
ncbi:hypothetical protein PI124_g6543 [Phytophthora idaei]|nr:hypothetical protein PI125_g7711 [Phytophthora idaei]KAG3166865.1 hypothetical protein PI126_g4022 [Phytophthora idaei]KAG3248804.1 hypothetical protein PI124_g6543 [Phytophthora idaei]